MKHNVQFINMLYPSSLLPPQSPFHRPRHQHLLHWPYVELHVPPPCGFPNSTMAFRTASSHTLAMFVTVIGFGSSSRACRNLFLQTARTHLSNATTNLKCTVLTMSRLIVIASKLTELTSMAHPIGHRQAQERSLGNPQGPIASAARQ